MKTTKIFYVDQTCIICDTCSTIAPSCFHINFKSDQAELLKQPSYEEETTKCYQALRACPVSAIRLKND